MEKEKVEEKKEEKKEEEKVEEIKEKKKEKEKGEEKAKEEEKEIVADEEKIKKKEEKPIEEKKRVEKEEREEENKKEEVKEKVEEKKEEKLEEKIEERAETEKIEDKKEEEKEIAAVEEKIKKKGEEKKEKKVEKKEEKPKKTNAIVHGKNLSISTKHSIAICNLIRGKRIDDATGILEKVLMKRKAVPMKGELPHRKGKEIMSGRYPINASKVFIKLLKALSANASANGLDLEKTRIAIAKANIASRPLRRFGTTKFKRTHIFLEAREVKQNLN